MHIHLGQNFVSPQIKRSSNNGHPVPGSSVQVPMYANWIPGIGSWSLDRFLEPRESYTCIFIIVNIVTWPEDNEMHPTMSWRSIAIHTSFDSVTRACTLLVSIYQAVVECARRCSHDSRHQFRTLAIISRSTSFFSSSTYSKHVIVSVRSSVSKDTYDVLFVSKMSQQWVAMHVNVHVRRSPSIDSPKRKVRMRTALHDEPHFWWTTITM